MLALLPIAALALTQSKGILHRPGIDLPYTVYGKGRPVVVISGGPGFTTDYELGIMKGCKTPNLEWIFLEQRGTPRARLDKGTEKDFAISKYVEDFDALRKQLHFAKWTVIGHSWGSMVAHAYVAAHPSNVAAVVFLGDVGPDTTSFQPASDNVDRVLNADELAAEAKLGGNAVTGPADDATSLKLFLIQLPGYFYNHANADKHRADFQDGCLVGNTENLVLPVLDKEHWNVSKAIAKYHGPAMVLQGRQDLLGESPAWKDRLAMSQTKVVFVEKAGHMPWMENPAAFFAALDGFLATNAR
jgi:proline iminopeptidase